MTKSDPYIHKFIQWLTGIYFSPDLFDDKCEGIVVMLVGWGHS